MYFQLFKNIYFRRPVSLPATMAVIVSYFSSPLRFILSALTACSYRTGDCAVIMFRQVNAQLRNKKINKRASQVFTDQCGCTCSLLQQPTRAATTVYKYSTCHHVPQFKLYMITRLKWGGWEALQYKPPDWRKDTFKYKILFQFSASRQETATKFKR